MLSNKEKELMTSEEKIDFVKSNIPESVYNVFNKEWDEFVYSCSENMYGLIDDETGDGEDFDKYLGIFMTYPH
jgi:hypothetical protein